MRNGFLYLLAFTWSASLVQAQWSGAGASYYPAATAPPGYSRPGTPAAASAPYTLASASYPYGYGSYGQGYPNYYYPNYTSASYGYPNYYGYPTQSSYAGYYGQASYPRQSYGGYDYSSNGCPNTGYPDYSREARYYKYLTNLHRAAAGELAAGTSPPPPHEEKPPVLWTNKSPEPDHFWASAEVLFGWFKNSPPTGPLVSTGFAGADIPGGVGQPGTQIVFGNEAIDYKLFTGVRAEVGWWLDCNNQFSLSLGGFWLPERSIHVGVNSDGRGNPVVARTFINAETRRESVEVNSFPDTLAGSTQVDARALLGGGELNFGWHSYSSHGWHLQGLAGFRLLRLREELTIRDQIIPLVDGIPIFLGQTVNVGDLVTVQDRFTTGNTFYGLQIGGTASWQCDMFFLDFKGKLGVGATEQSVNIAGVTTRISPVTGTERASGGILALPTNIGSHYRTQVSGMAEVGLDVGVDLTSWLRLRAGYTFLAWSGVVRPGEQIDRTLSRGQIPTDPSFGLTPSSNRPVFHFNEDLFYASTFSLGLEAHY